MLQIVVATAHGSTENGENSSMETEPFSMPEGTSFWP